MAQPEKEAQISTSLQQESNRSVRRIRRFCTGESIVIGALAALLI